jgi:cytochrome c peroxidase
MTMTCRGSKSLIEKIQLSTDDVDKITAFLDSLTGEQPKVTYPVLPPSVGATPRPQP